MTAAIFLLRYLQAELLFPLYGKRGTTSFYRENKMAKNEFTPKLLTVLKEGIPKGQLVRDVVSGIIVGIVALPLAIAFAIASGVSPRQGLVTAVIAGFIISAFGGSRVQIGGPTGAFVIIVYGIIRDYGNEGLVAATFIAGFLMILMGILRFGSFLKYISYPLVVGFTNGIAVIIFSTQIKDFLGYSDVEVPAGFAGKWYVYFSNIGKINVYAAAVAVAAVILTLFFHKVSKKIPGSLVAIVACTAAVMVFRLPVETIETRFGSIPSGLGMPVFPVLDREIILQLIKPAIAIALLGSIESLLSAVVADGMTGAKHRSNIELVAQGGANIASAMFGGIPATGAIARTATNVKNGGRTPVAGIVHALTLFLIMILFSQYAKLIPLSALAGILVVVAARMGEWDEFFLMLKGHYLDMVVLLVTFFLTVFVDLVIAIETGFVLSSLASMKRFSEAVSVKSRNDIIEEKADEWETLFDEELPAIPEGVLLYEINGPLFFGAAKEFQETLEEIHEHPQVLILRMRHVSFIDATGVYRLKETITRLHDKKIKVILSGVNRSVKEELLKGNIVSVIDKEMIVSTISRAIIMAKHILAGNRRENDASLITSAMPH